MAAGRLFLQLLPPMPYSEPLTPHTQLSSCPAGWWTLFMRKAWPGQLSSWLRPCQITTRHVQWRLLIIRRPRRWLFWVSVGLALTPHCHCVHCCPWWHPCCMSRPVSSGNALETNPRRASIYKHKWLHYPRTTKLTDTLWYTFSVNYVRQLLLVAIL